MTKDERIAELEKQIKELSEEHFEMFGDMKNYKNLWLAEQSKYAELRHEICEKIRLYCRDRFEPVPDKLGCIAEINREKFFEFIDQIERGEE